VSLLGCAITILNPTQQPAPEQGFFLFCRKSLLPFPRRAVYLIAMTTGVEDLPQSQSANSEEEFAGFVRRYVNLVYSVALRRLENAALAEEATQLVFIRVAKTRPKFTTEGQTISWLHRTATNIAIDLWRSETRRRAREKEALLMQTESTETIPEELARQLDQAIDQLTEPEREAILLRFYSANSHSQVADALGITEDAAKMRVHRAVATLRKRLASAGVVCAEALLLAFLEEQLITAAPAGLAAKLAKLKFASAGIGVALKIVSVCVVALSLCLVAIQQRKNQNVRIAEPRLDPRQTSIPTEKVPTNFEKAVESTTSDKLTVLRLVNADTGQPANDALVRIEFLARPFAVLESVHLRTSPDGFLRIPEPNVVGAKGLRLYVFAEGCLPVCISGWGGSGEVKIDSGRAFSGIVVDEDGQPAANVEIRIKDEVDISSAASSMKTAFMENEAIVISDLNGQWQLPFVPKWWSETSVFLRKDGYALTVATFPTRDESPREAKLIIKRGKTIEGQVTDSEGKPIANAQVERLQYKGFSIPEYNAKSDQAGFFALKGMEIIDFPPIPVIRVSARGYAVREKQVELRQNTNIVNFVLPTSGHLRGRVIDDAGMPVPKVFVHVHTEEEFAFSEFRFGAETDELGRFEWAQAPDEIEYDFLSNSRLSQYYRPDKEENGMVVRLRADGTEHVIRMEANTHAPTK
jgi:RNA polymerase sigma factor (sigma-70 family)